MQDDPEVAARLARYELVFRMQARGPGLVDELGYDVAENPVSVYDLHATLLHLLGIDHTKLTIRTQGRDFRLTDVHGHVVRDLIA